MILTTINLNELRQISKMPPEQARHAYVQYWIDLVSKYVQGFNPQRQKVDVTQIAVSPIAAQIVFSIPLSAEYYSFPLVDPNLEPDECYINEQYVLKDL